MRAIGQLEKLKVLKEVSEAKRDWVYCAKAILDILEAPAPHSDFNYVMRSSLTI